jgi:hypothetical protein
MKTETFVERQVRNILEGQCAKLFRATMSALPKDAAATLLLVDYGEKGAPFSNTAYITSLPLAELIVAVEALVLRWRSGSTESVPHDREQHGWVPDAAELVGIGRAVKEVVPAGVGFALLFGRGGDSQYLATIERAGMIELFENELLPTWRAEVAAK